MRAYSPISMTVTIAVVIFLVPTYLSARVDFAGGTGEPNDPYQIATAGQLISIGADPNLLDKSFILIADLDLDPNLPARQIFTQAVIAPDTDAADPFQGSAFTGSFDGSGHTVNGLTIQAPAMGWLGLFGFVGEGGRVRHLGLKDVHVTGLFNTGGLAGGSQGTIEDCYATGAVIGGEDSSSLGGLVGDNWGGSISKSHAAVTVIGGPRSSPLGGLVGWNIGNITDCHATGNVTGGEDSWGLGGLAGIAAWGRVAEPGMVVNCQAKGNVSGASGSFYLGGLVGLCGNGPVRNCHATGNVSAGDGASYLGGLVGLNGEPGDSLDSYGNTICRSYATGDVSSGPMSHSIGGLAGGNVSGTITNCCARGLVQSDEASAAIGGLVGDNGVQTTLTDLSRNTIANCYASGAVSVAPDCDKVGGLLGFSRLTCITASFWDVERSGLAESAGGTGLTTAQIQDVQTFVDAGWDLVDERANGTSNLWLAPEGGGYLELVVFGAVDALPALEGAGIPGDPYQIATAQDLGAMCHYDPMACYELVADIDLAGITWSTAPIPDFGGTFSGAGHVVSSLTVDGGAYLGLFGRLDPGASVANLGVEGARIVGADLGRYLGTLAGQNMGSIASCYATGDIFSGDWARGVGGLVGENGDQAYTESEGMIADSHAGVAISSGGYAVCLGGLVGCGWIDRSLRRCYATGRVTAGEESRSLGPVIGGLGTRASHIATAQCYFLVSVDGDELDTSIGAPLTDEQMKQQASFTDWDFDATWMICEGQDYPHLQWEGISCDR